MAKMAKVEKKFLNSQCNKTEIFHLDGILMNSRKIKRKATKKFCMQIHVLGIGLLRIHCLFKLILWFIFNNISIGF